MQRGEASVRPAWAAGLEGRTAVVTGASRGIGRAIASALAQAGATVLAVARSAGELAALAGETAGVEPWPADVGDPAFHAALSARGDLDILVSNAGMNRPLPIADVPVETLDAMLSLNVRSAFLVAQAAARAMLAHGRGGAIIHMSSQMGHVGSPNRTVYCMTKHAVEGLSKAMAVELAPHGVRSNTVAPTFIDSPWTAAMIADPEFKRFVLDSIPAGRLGRPEEVAAAVVYLASPAAAMVTGTSLVVDGGWTAR
jgi:NAD(P)-dependent dehydrogenase (short-subunit alcohol dehydrogenase family)